jgi:hypothetical protein
MEDCRIYLPKTSCSLYKAKGGYTFQSSRDLRLRVFKGKCLYSGQDAKAIQGQDKAEAEVQGKSFQ